MTGRTGYQKGTDRARGSELEQLVGSWLGEHKIENYTATDKLDVFLPGAWCEIKGKFQALNAKWHLLPGVPEEFLFVLDELSVRRAMLHAPHAYFILSTPEKRFYLARVDEVACCDHVRVNREGHDGHLKGKWIIDLRHFRELANPETELRSAILSDQTELPPPWKASHCLSQQGVPTV